jgi:hypothetical protein
VHGPSLFALRPEQCLSAASDLEDRVMQLHSHSLLMVNALRLGAVAVVLLLLPLLLPVWNVTPLGVVVCAGVPGAVVVAV